MNILGGIDMKKEYTTPVAEKITFHYKEQVTASNDCYWVGQTTRSYPNCQETHTGAMTK